MEKFSLDKYLENPSRKVVTRRGNPVRIICTDRKHGEDDLPIVFLEECSNGGEFLLTCKSDGTPDYNHATLYDLFFADEKEELTEFEKAIYQYICTIVTACDGEWTILDEESTFDWQSFRAEAAKDILCAMIAKFGIKDKLEDIIIEDIKFSIACADVLIAKLKETEEK